MADTVAYGETELQRRRWQALAVTSIGSFLTPLDASIVAVALPTMGPPLHLSYSAALWVQAAYLLVTSMLLIPAGRLADRHGTMGYFLLGTGIFAVGSIGAALALNGPFLIVARCVQGAGGAFAFATATAVVTAAFPPRERGRAIGLNIMATYLGLTAGPPLGGLIVSHTSWRWIFLINVPIAAVVLLTGWGLAKAERRDRAAAARAAAAGRIDFTGALLLGGLLVALFVPLTFSPIWGWTGARTIVPLVLAVLFLVAFILVEDRVADPIFHLDLLRKNRVFAAANSATLLNYMAVFGVTTLTAVYLQIVRNTGAQTAGLILLAQPVVMVILSPFTGRLSDRIGSRIPATLGMVLIAGGMFQLAFLSTAWWQTFVALATVGLGMAFFSAPNVSAVMGSVDRSQLSLASGFLSAMRFTGQGISIALLGAIAALGLGPSGGRIILLGETASKNSAAPFAHGYKVAMLVGAALVLVGALVSSTAEPKRQRPAEGSVTSPANAGGAVQSTR